MKRLLLVEDDSTLAMGLVYSLEREGYQVDHGNTFARGKNLVDQMDFDLIILDIGLPDGNGFELCSYIREGSNVPIIFLTAEDEEVNVVMGFELGGDDYISKPFRVQELQSRIKAILRRVNYRKKDILISKDISLNIDENKVYKGKELLNLTPLEYRLVNLFMKNPKVNLKRSRLLDEIWDSYGDFVDDNSLSVYIKRLREKIEDQPSKPNYIKTIRGIGYSWGYEVRGE